MFKHKSNILQFTLSYQAINYRIYISLPVPGLTQEQGSPVVACARFRPVYVVQYRPSQSQSVIDPHRSFESHADFACARVVCISIIDPLEYLSSMHAYPTPTYIHKRNHIFIK